ncbi:serine protease inhibitor 77Ba-like [Periplaneta americana]|uniref:serine protease inhibitor 77Ba-like n=1 Tax=Periplaneta americana TaxID=6978 RepID=UPI0037E8AEA1
MMMKSISYILSGLLWCSALAQPTSPRPLSNSELSVTTGSTQFALELLHATSLEAGRYMNVAISPISVWAVLALMREGAGGKTKSQLQTALHLNENNRDIRNAYRKIDRTIHVVTDGVEMIGASALFTDPNRPVQWEFEYLADNIYKAFIQPVNFANTTGTVNFINRWVGNVTRNRITQLVHEEDMKDPHLVIASGNFFKGNWLLPFNSSNTITEKFYDDKGVELGEVQMMHQNSHFRYSRMTELGAKVVELPYEGQQFSMLVVVPIGNTTIDELLERLTKTTMEKIYHRMTTEDEEFPDAFVEVFLPRVVINSDYVLNKALEKLGIHDVFNDAKADLSGISPHNIHLHKLIHKAEVVIDEEGTVASSATGGVMSERQQVPKIRANRPFAFFIVENSLKVILYAGKVVNPHNM